MSRVPFVLMLTVVLGMPVRASEPPTVSNVTALQRTDGSRIVDISYTLSDPDSDTVGVRVKVSNDAGNTYNIIPVTMTGDVGLFVTATPTPTAKSIAWNAGEDMPYTFGSNFRVAVIAHDCVGYTGDIITIPAGPFQMGNNGHEGYSRADELPQHQTTLSEYQIGKYEVTRGEYHRFIKAGGYEIAAYWSTDSWAWRVANHRTQPDGWTPQQNWGSPPGVFTQTDAHPIVGVTYYEAEAFCKWASLCDPDGPAFHLPTEAQWEKAARWDAATSTPRTYPWGDQWDVSRCKNWDDMLFPRYQTAPVGSYTNPSGESPYGCKDMAGNVWEWCKDWYGFGYYSQTPPGGWVDPQGPESGGYRVQRGGAWNENISGGYRCAFRTYATCTYGSVDYGFRLARCTERM